MKPNLKYGKLLPPKDLHNALLRQDQLPIEIGKIEMQLNDPARITRYKTVAEFDRWRDSARSALVLFKSEQRQLGEWIKAHEQPEDLFREAYDLLNKLEVEVDFEPTESALMVRLDEYFKTRKTKAA
jgi:hypothetical protein